MMSYIALIRKNTLKEGYRVIFPDFPNCTAGGETLSAALTDAEWTLAKYVLSLTTTPDASSREAIVKLPQSVGAFIYNCPLTFRNMR